MIFRTLRCQFLVEHVDLPAASGVEDARWEHFQLEFFNDDSTFRHDNKGRQIAWSFAAAADALADAHLDGISSIFISINLNEAKEKIHYAKAIREAITPGLAPQFVRQNQLEVELANGARLISLPSRPPRGKARFNIYGDEFAHVQRDREIYKAALPVISKGGKMRLGSSPMGASGVFWEIGEQQFRPYPGYTRKATPWWETFSFCVNPVAARRLAPAMESFQRVELFGNDRIKAIFANMPLEDFQQEYECVYVDEVTAWISWDEIRMAQALGAELLCILATGREKQIDAALQAIDELAAAIDKLQVESYLAAGMDVGRTRHTTEIFFVGISTLLSFPLRLAITLDRCDFDAQHEVLVYALQKLPLLGLFIDRNGLGMQLAEQLEAAYPGKVAGVDFTNPVKASLATEAKMLIQQKKTPLPVDRDIAYQIHSIKRTVTSSKNLVFDTTQNEKHHADKFWAWTLGLSVARALVGQPAEGIVVQDESVSISDY